MTNLRHAALAAALMLGACNDEPHDADDDGDVADARAALTPTELLTRASLDLRGVRPSVDELRKVEKNPDAVDAMIAAFVDDPAFGERVKSMYAGAWRTRIDDYPLPDEVYDDYDLEQRLNAAIGEEPLNLLSYIALNDRPVTELLHSEVTFIDPVMLDYWPLEEVAGEGQLPPGTVRARYSDERPIAGVLSFNSVYWRHSSTVENSNRGRTNALSQALLCQSYLDRPIDFPTDLDLTDSESIRHAIATNAACQGCHSTLDPFASYLWGFMYGESDVPEATYRIEQERAWMLYTGATPAFFGQGGERMQDLANHVAGDERFISCTVRRMYEGMLGRPAVLADEGALSVHREAFLAGGLTFESLARSILTDPSYRGETWEQRFGGNPEPVHEKVAPVEVLAGSLAELSGFSLTYGGRPGARLDEAVRRLAGGSDRGDTTNVSTGAVLVQRRLAEGGALYAVAAAAQGKAGGGRLDAYLGGVDLAQAPSPKQVVQLIELARTRSIDEDAAQVEALVTLWNDVAAIGNPNEAWVALLTTVLADPDHLLY